MKRSYSELCKLKTFDERFRYLMLNGMVGETTFGSSRYLNQRLYHSNEWKEIQRVIRIRDKGNDLGIPGRPIMGYIYVHHLNPISVEDVAEGNPDILDPENLISVSFIVHSAIHYGDDSILLNDYIERRPNDTIPWR